MQLSSIPFARYCMIGLSSPPALSCTVSSSFAELCKHLVVLMYAFKVQCDCVQLSQDEQKQVLGKRRGNTLSRRSILKSYHPHVKRENNVIQVEGVSEIRQAKGQPVYTMGSATTRGLRRSAMSWHYYLSCQRCNRLALHRSANACILLADTACSALFVTALVCACSTTSVVVPVFDGPLTKAAIAVVVPMSTDHSLMAYSWLY